MVATRLGILAWNPAEAAVNKVRAPEAVWGWPPSALSSSQPQIRQTVPKCSATRTLCGARMVCSFPLTWSALPLIPSLVNSNHTLLKPHLLLGLTVSTMSPV